MNMVKTFLVSMAVGIALMGCKNDEVAAAPDAVVASVDAVDACDCPEVDAVDVGSDATAAVDADAAE